MKVARISSLNIHQNIEPTNKKQDNTNYSVNQITELPNYQVAFGANLKPVQTTMSNGKYKLLKELGEIFQEELREIKPTETIIDSYNKLRQTRYKDEKYDMLYDQAHFLFYNRDLFNPQMAYEEALRIKKASRKLDKQKRKPEFTPIKAEKQENPLDFKLLHKFETAIQDERFDLHPVFVEYYSDLNSIKTIKELHKKYPKIKTPKHPAEVVSDKYLSVLTKDFYDALDELYHNSKSSDEINAFIEQKVHQITSQIMSTNKKLKHKTLDVAFEKVEKLAKKKINLKYQTIIKEDRLSTYPVHRKVKIPQLSDNDIALMSVDFNDFVLQVLRKQYLEFKNPSEVVIGNIKVSSLKDPAYKFEKVSDKIRNIISKSGVLHKAQRNYDIYTVDNLKMRLAFYADRIDNNERMLEKIIVFSGCKFEPEDIKMLKGFLKELDAVFDGQKTIEQAIESIESQKLRPTGTERLNEIERKKAIEAIKAEQKKLARLTNKQETFDNAILALYEKDLNETAEICSKYRPQSLSKEELETSDFIVKLITKNINNPDRLETSIARWNTYYEYKTAHLNDEILQKAELYAKQKDGKIDIDKAGKYIMNYEIVQNYPASLELAQNRELVEKIIKMFDKKEKLDAVNYLCRLDDYNDLMPKEKSHISAITNLFGLRDSTDKMILKHIIENEYVKTDTENYLNIAYSGEEKVKTIITANAKQEIADYYQFPRSLVFYRLFEDAMTKLAKTKATAGIKHLGGNNERMNDVYELKIKGHDDRLLSYDGTYRFDIFDSTGLHK